MTIESSLRHRAQSARRLSNLATVLAVLFAAFAFSVLPLLFTRFSTVLDRKHDTALLYGIVTLSVYSLLAILLLIFAVNTLLHFSKYYTRLASHFEAVADALVLAGNRPECLKDFFEITLGNVPFGKAPSTPIDEIANLVEKLSKIKSAAHE